MSIRQARRSLSHSDASSCFKTNGKVMFSIEDRVRPGPLRQRRRARICGRGGPLVLGLSGYAPLALEEAPAAPSPSLALARPPHVS